jgi:hypothetical protein
LAGRGGLSDGLRRFIVSLYSDRGYPPVQQGAERAASIASAHIRLDPIEQARTLGETRHIAKLVFAGDQYRQV